MGRGPVWSTRPLHLCWHYLSSRSVSRQVLSAQVSLTTVFGMGTGGPSPQSTPTAYILTDFSAKIKMEFSKEGIPHRALPAPHGDWCAFTDSNRGPTD